MFKVIIVKVLVSNVLVSIVNFEYISYLVLVFLLLVSMQAGIVDYIYSKHYSPLHSLPMRFSANFPKLLKRCAINSDNFFTFFFLEVDFTDSRSVFRNLPII